MNMKWILLAMSMVAFIGVTLGELGRIPILTASGLLPNDFLVGITVMLWGFHKTLKERRWPQSPLWGPFVLFSAIAGLSLALASGHLSHHETLQSGFYWVRFVEYFAWTFVIIDCVDSKVKNAKILLSVMVASAVTLSVLGFLQLQFFPDFEEMQELGWDPHFYRLLSTWFDPNFLGGMLLFMLSVVGGRFLKKQKMLQKTTWGIVGITLMVALFLTYSRSAYLALIVSIVTLGIIRSPKLLVAGVLTGLLLTSISPRAHERVIDMVYSAKSLVSDTAELPDATARLRIESWENAWAIFKTSPLLGVGFNAYAQAQQEYGFVDSRKVHSSSGSDSTLLTILATTGIVGFTAYGWLLGTMLYVCFKNRENPTALGTFAGLTGLLVHSIFVNSLLFSPLLLFVYTAVGLSHKTRA